MDVRIGIRTLWKRPGFLMAAVATLAIGIGANATVFAFVDALLLRPLPFGNRSDRIVTLHSTHPTLAPDWSSGTMSYSAIDNLPSQTKAFEAAAGYIGRSVVLTGGDVAERVRGGLVTPGLFAVLGTEPIVGRAFVDGDARDPGFEEVVLLSHGLWTRVFGADPSVAGRSIQLNGRSLAVIGVMPPGFRFPERDDLWLPYRPADENQRRYNRNLFGVAALASGVSIEQAQEELDRISANLQAEFPENRNWTMRVIPFRQAFVGPEAPLLFGTMLAAVVFVLAIGCANLTNLLLARGITQQKEIAIRAAIGASRARLIRQMIVEGLIVSGVGGLLGVLAAMWATTFIVAAAPEDLPHWAQIQIDTRVLLFSLAASGAATVMFGLWPAFRTSRPNLIQDLKEASPRASGSRKQHRLQTGLVIAQIAMCLGLLTGANMMVRSFMRLMNADAGFMDSHLLSFRVALSGDTYDSLQAKTSFIRFFENELGSIPGVANVGTTTSIPIDDGGIPQRIAIPDRTRTADEEIGVSAIYITPGFFQALDLAPVEGRWLTRTETESPTADVVVVSRSFAREFWPNGSAIGQRIGITTARGPVWFQIAGVAPDMQFEEFGEETVQSRRNIYYGYGRIGSRGLSFMVRAQGDPAGLFNSVRATLRRVDRSLPAFELRTMSEVRANTNFEQRILGQLMGVFGAIALFLSCLGLYGVLSYSFRQRSWEIGMRVALGATPYDVARLVFRQGMQTALAGIALGILLSFVVARALTRVLYQVSPTEPGVFVSTILLMAGVVLLAIGIPARRATRVDPMAAIRVG